MSDKIIETTVFLTGTKKAITSVLNRVFWCNSRSDYKIADDDSLETINGKIKAANEHIADYLTGYTLMDYMDLYGRMNSPFKDIILSYIDEEEPDGSENYDANPEEVTANGDEYTLKIVSRVKEGQRTYDPEDWHYWSAMISISDGCLISLKKDIV